MPQTITVFFEHTHHGTATPWTRHRCDDQSLVAELARALAANIVSEWFVDARAHYYHWLAVARGHVSGPSGSEAILRAYIRRGFGLPGQELPADHLEGCVAEHLWYFLCKEACAGDRPVYVHPVGLAPTSHGADGFCIHQQSDGALALRLWEIKKNTGRQPVSSTVNEAYGQLAPNAMEYLALLGRAPAAVMQDAALVGLWNRRSETWEAAGPAAGAGISIATSNAKLPTKCFSTFAKHFPRLSRPDQLRGALKGVLDFGAFAVLVRDELWSGS